MSQDLWDFYMESILEFNEKYKKKLNLLNVDSYRLKFISIDRRFDLLIYNKNIDKIKIKELLPAIFRTYKLNII